MAIPSTPQQFNVQTQNRQNLVSWALSAGATSYEIQRSLDNVTYTSLATISGSPLSTSYVDSAVTIGLNYWYKVAAISADGTSNFTLPQSVVPVPTAEMSLGQIRKLSQMKADRLNSQFVTLPEWNEFINLAMYELYDLLISQDQDLFITTPIQFAADGTTFLYPLPDGATTYMSGININNTLVARPFYKLSGVDLALQTATNAYVTINKFNFIDRNRFVYPNTASTIYGVFNLQYRLVGTHSIEFIPTPSAGQNIRLWYVPRLTALLQDTDISDNSISGWIQYVIVRAAKYALDKEESDTQKLDQELLFLKERIETMASNRDVGQPDRVSDTRSGNGNGWGTGGFGSGFNGGSAGWGFLFPGLMQYDVGNASLVNSIFVGQSLLIYAAFGVTLAYFLYNYRSNFSRAIIFSKMFSKFRLSLPSFSNHIINVLLSSSNKQMIGINTVRIVTGVTDVQTFRDRSNKELVSFSSRNEILIAHRKSWATISTQTTSPQPTIFGFVDFFKKTLNRITSLSHKAIISLIRGNKQ